MIETHRRFAFPTGLLLAALTAGCGGDIVLPDEGEAAKLEIVSGDEQVGPAGTTLAQQVVVRVLDTRERPVANQDVTFTIGSGGGTVAPTTVKSDAAGQAAASWTLGPNSGDHLLRAQTPRGGSGMLEVTAHATAVAGSGSVLAEVSGDEQIGPVSSALADSLVVKATDALGNPVANVEVTWSVSGGGSIAPATVVTGADGLAAAERVLGPSAGAQSAQATVDGFTGSPVTFSHTAIPANPTVLLLVSGDDQTAPGGFEVAGDLVVRLEDDNGNGIGGRQITWVVPAGAGSVSPVNSMTDGNGLASTRWTLPTTVGSHTVNAVFSGLPPVQFTANATADIPTTIELVSGDGQSASIGTSLPNPLVVRVTDASGIPVAGVSVAWTAEGGGAVSAGNSPTNASGLAQVTRTLGLLPGTYTTTAAVDRLAGSPITFTSTATVGPPAKVVFIDEPSAVVVGQQFSPIIRVEIRDVGDNLVASATSLVTITSSRSGTLTGDNTQNAVGGIAVFPGLAITRANTSYTLNALSSNLTSDVSQPFDVSKASTSIAITSDNPDPSVVGQTATINYDINILAPGAGNPTGSVTVSDGTQSCQGGINAGTGQGNCQIAFTTVGDRSLSATYSGDQNFDGSASSSIAHRVNQASTVVEITSDNPDPSATGESVTVAYSVSSVAPGGGTPGGDVTITVSGGDETCTGTVAAGSCNIVFTVAGNDRTITATYSGNPEYAGDSDTELHDVSAPNGPPDAVDDAYQVDEGVTLSIDAANGVLFNDTDPEDDALTAVNASDPAGGTVTLELDGSFMYTPDPGFTGIDTFTYQANDGQADADAATVTITVNDI